MRTSLGLQGSLLLLMVFGSAALTFFVPRPRLLCASLLAAVCGFGYGRLGAGWNAMFDTAAEAWPLLLAPVLFGAGFAWRSPWPNSMAAGLLGIPYGVAVMAGLLSNCWGCGEPYYSATFAFILIGAVVATVGATLTVALRALVRRIRS